VVCAKKLSTLCMTRKRPARPGFLTNWQGRGHSEHGDKRRGEHHGSGFGGPASIRESAFPSHSVRSPCLLFQEVHHVRHGR